jgi:hypothetical protein
MNLIYLLWFVHALDTAEEDELFIGAYSTAEEANAAIERLKNKPGFADAPDGFQIHPYEINRDDWTEGFVLKRGSETGSAPSKIR